MLFNSNWRCVYVYYDWIAATLVKTFSEGSPVYGIGKIRENIYVIHDSNSSIFVYDSSYNRYNSKKNIHVDGMKGPYDMVVSKVVKSAFIVDWFNSSDVIRVNVNPPYSSSHWCFIPDSFTSAGLSLIQESENILLTESASGKIKEFSQTGNLVNSITLKNITNPRHAVKINEDRYAVCSGYNETTDKHQVCLVDDKGYTVGACFGDHAGNSTSQLNVPARLYYRQQDDSLLVVDMKNQRILKISASKLRIPAQVIVAKVGGQSGWYRMLLDEDLLYVADNTLDPQTGYATSGRVLLFKL